MPADRYMLRGRDASSRAHEKDHSIKGHRGVRSERCPALVLETPSYKEHLAWLCTAAEEEQVPGTWQAATDLLRMPQVAVYRVALFDPRAFVCYALDGCQSLRMRRVQ